MPPVPPVPLLRWDQAEAFGAAVALTTRHGGVSDPPYDTLNLGLHVGDHPARVLTNRDRAATAFGTTLDAMVFAHQVHGAAVAHVGRDDAGRGSRGEDDVVAGTDVLVTDTPGLTLVVTVADCVPLALVDPEARVLAVVHAGWRGTAAGAVTRALEAVGEHGGRPERVRAFFGPAVRPDRYQVSEEVRRALAAAVAPAALDHAVARADGSGHWLVDLVAANRQQLARGGLSSEHVSDCGASTADDAFFSHRAQRPCGRFALLARLLG